MNAGELAAIREDVDRAVVEAYLNGDTPLLPDVVNRLLGKLGEIATGQPGAPPGLLYISLAMQRWAAELLRDVHTRAVSRIPYGEPTHGGEPEDHR